MTWYNITLGLLMWYGLYLLISCASAPPSDGDGITRGESLGIITLDREFRQ